jgi:DNA-binding response OmpR family regulator
VAGHRSLQGSLAGDRLPTRRGSRAFPCLIRVAGYDLLKEIRGDPNLAGTPFIMVTAESKTDNVIAAKKAGVNNYIVKPFNAQTLKSKIETVFAG